MLPYNQDSAFLVFFFFLYKVKEKVLFILYWKCREYLVDNRSLLRHCQTSKMEYFLEYFKPFQRSYQKRIQNSVKHLRTFRGNNYRLKRISFKEYLFPRLSSWICTSSPSPDDLSSLKGIWNTLIINWHFDNASSIIDSAGPGPPLFCKHLFFLQSLWRTANCVIWSWTDH